MNMMKKAGSEKLENVNSAQLMTLMEKLMQGDDLSTLPPSLSGMIKSDSSAKIPLPAVDEEKDGSVKLLSTTNFATNATYREIIARQIREEKESHEDVAAKKQFVYKEQQQKLDLTMKIQQARQRQNLQRKLFERKQASNAK
jgi:hypothetical protein